MGSKKEEVGRVTHFYSKISVCVIELTQGLNVGDRIHFIGTTTDFEQDVISMEIDHESVKEAHPGDAIGMKTDRPVRENDRVVKI